MSEEKLFAIEALERMLGDNTARAKAMFKNCTKEEMNQEYGESEKTRAQIISEYEEYDAKVNAAIQWVKAQNE